MEPIQFTPPSIEKLAELLPSYKFECLIAQGGMGAVYRAHQTSLDRLVAIKILPPELGESESFRDSFKKEAKLMARLNHPNLISVFDCGEIDGMLYIVMEFVEGDTLYNLTHKLHLEQKEALSTVIGICSGVDNAHESNILHRDIKPANIFITRRGTPKVGDFGLARPAEESEQGTIYGTPGYTAPEVLSSPKSVGPPTDVFAIGIILYELLTGLSPKTPYEPAHKYADCSPSIDPIIRKAINPSLENRYKSAKEFKDDLEELLQKLTKTGNASPFITPNSKAGAGASTPSLNTQPVNIYQKKKKASPFTKLIVILLLLCGIYGAYEWKKVIDAKNIKIEEENAKMAAKNAAAKAQAIEERKAQLKELREQRKARRKEMLTKKSTEKSTETQETASNQQKPDQPSAEPQKTPIEIIELLKERLVQGERPLEELPESKFLSKDGTRVFVFIDKKYTWEDADEWSRAHGGYLATVENSNEFNRLGAHIPEDSTAWIGAFSKRDEKTWLWSNGTPWNKALSLPQTSKDAFVQIGIDKEPNVSSEIAKAGFLVEWRIDGWKPDSPFLLLQNKVRTALISAVEKREIADAATTESFIKDIDRYYKALPKKKKTAQKFPIKKLKRLVQNNPITDEEILNECPEDLKPVLEKALKKQSRFDSKYSRQLAKMQQGYQKRLQTMIDQLNAKKDVASALKVQKALEASHVPAQEFEAIFIQ